ncbi:MAG: DUF4886 domain-containing protein [Candidatus Sumerlaeota bacterium]
MQKQIKLLTIGNSFANNSTRYLQDLVDADPSVSLVLGKANLGGCSLQRHWRHVAAYEANPEDPQGSPYRGKSLNEILHEQDWDIITIQQVSMQSSERESYYPYAENLIRYVQKHSPESEIRIHMTWAYRSDDPRFRKGDDSQGKMYADLKKNYWTIAAEHNLKIIPVGKAFQVARSHPYWQYRPDPDYNFDSPPYLKLPDQSYSLCAGYYWRKKKDLDEYYLTMDGHHANEYGQYLGACVFFECMYAKSVLNNPFVPEEIDKEDAAFLQRIAHQTVSQTPETQNPPDVKAVDSISIP